MRSCLSIITALLLCLSNYQAFSSHVVGMDIWYEHRGADTFRVYGAIYYDCSGGATTPLPGPANILYGFYVHPQSNGCPPPTVTGPRVYVSYKEISPVCLLGQTRCTNPSGPFNGHLQQLWYQDYLVCTSCPTCLYRIEFSECCRSGNISSGANNESFYAVTTLNPSIPGNHSPKFSDVTALYIEAGAPAYLWNKAYDPEGDSIAYKLDTCFKGYQDPVTYSAGFSPQNPLGSTWTTYLDPQNGDLLFTPSGNGGGSVQIGVVGIRAEEYRNGVKIGQSFRDIQVNVVVPASGITDPAPVLSIANVTNGQIQGSDSLIVAWGDTLTFDVVAQDSSANEVIDLEVHPSAYFNGALTGTSQGADTIHATLVPSVVPGVWLKVKAIARDKGCLKRHKIEKIINIKVLPEKYLTPVITPSTCQVPAGSIQVVPTGLQHPITYQWSTGDTTASLTGLLPGAYMLTATDAAGFSITDTFWVPSGNLQLVLTPYWPACDSVTGMLSASVYGGTPPFSYNWNTGSTATTLAGVPAGGYSLTVSDSTGCHVHAACHFQRPDTCQTYVSGRAFVDYNNNCQLDTADTVLPGMPLLIHKNITHAVIYTQQDGSYGFFVKDTATTITPLTGSYAFPAPLSAHPSCLSGFPLTVPVSTYGTSMLDIPFQSLPIPSDARAIAYSARTRPGAINRMDAIIGITSTIPCTANVTLAYDPRWHQVSAGPSLQPVSIDSANRIIHWQIQHPGTSLTSYVCHARASVDASVPAGVLLYDTLSVQLQGCNDPNPTNNTLLSALPVRAAFDPNDKQVQPAGAGPQGFLPPADSLLTYTVRFQNTGTDTAWFVTIRDTLSPLLDPQSLTLLGTSHPNYRVSLLQDSILVVAFDYIMLPDSLTNPSESQGFISFQVQAANWHHMGAIHNRAAIYFDFNAPVITNTVTSTRCIPVSVSFDVFTSALHEVVPVNTSSGTTGSMRWIWDLGNGDTVKTPQPQPFTYADTGLYTITLTGENECSADTFTQVYFAQRTNIFPSVFAAGVTVIPHPVTSLSEVRFPNPGSQPATLHLSDIQGREVWKGQTHTSTAWLDRTGLPAGVYVLRISGPGTAVVKVVME